MRLSCVLLVYRAVLVTVSSEVSALALLPRANALPKGRAHDTCVPVGCPHKLNSDFLIF